MIFRVARISLKGVWKNVMGLVEFGGTLVKRQRDFKPIVKGVLRNWNTVLIFGMKMAVVMSVGIAPILSDRKTEFSSENIKGNPSKCWGFSLPYLFGVCVGVAGGVGCIGVIEKASAAVIDATIIQTAGGKQRQAIEVDEEGQVSGQTTPGKDSDARRTKKNGLYKLGYKQHTRIDAGGYIEKLHITPANTHECYHLSPLLEGIAEGTTVYADKGYDSKENRQHLEEHRLQDGIMRKAHRNRPLTEAQTKRNRYLSKTRYVVEQSFGTLHRKFRYARAAYFGLCKVSAQSHLKAMCLNLLKAANRLSVPVAA